MATQIAPGTLADRAAAIARDVAGPAADAVDRDARFPREAIDALRHESLLGVLVPERFGGAGASLTEVADACSALGQQCASTGMIYAMHQIQVACIVGHGLSPFWQEYQAELASVQPLLASATSEVGIGGDLRSSRCAVEREGDRFTLTKEAAVVSYGAHADAVLVTARRTSDAAPGDQVLVLAPRASTTMQQSGEWSTLGFRGTCSPGFSLRTSGHVEQLLDEPFGAIATRTMLPVSHILWASVWLGIAGAALSRARSVIRKEARKTPDALPPSMARLTTAVATLQSTRAVLRDAIREYERCASDPDAVASIGFTVRMNNLKILASERVVELVGQAMLVCGMQGYRLDTPLSLGRHLRDAYGAALMINNDRIARSNAAMLLATSDD